MRLLVDVNYIYFAFYIFKQKIDTYIVKKLYTQMYSCINEYDKLNIEP